MDATTRDLELPAGRDGIHCDPRLVMPARGLVIRQPHIGKILDGDKTWEMRSRPTKIRGRIGLIEAGSGLVVGEAEILRMQEAPKTLLARHMTRVYHRLPEERYSAMDKWCWAWVLENAIRYDTPIPYEHPQGAVIWVSLRNTKVERCQPTDHE